MNLYKFLCFGWQNLLPNVVHSSLAGGGAQGRSKVSTGNSVPVHRGWMIWNRSSRLSWTGAAFLRFQAFSSFAAHLTISSAFGNDWKLKHILAKGSSVIFDNTYLLIFVQFLMITSELIFKHWEGFYNKEIIRKTWSVINSSFFYFCSYMYNIRTLIKWYKTIHPLFSHKEILVIIYGAQFDGVQSHQRKEQVVVVLKLVWSH